jgi:hypothetical protein
MALGLTQLTEMSNRNLSWGCNERPAREANNLTAIYGPIV